MNPALYRNNSGGAKGADLEWDKIGREFGVVNHKHFKPSDLKALPLDVFNQLKLDVRAAAIALHRPFMFPGIELVYRNWLQVVNSGAIYAISRIVEPGDEDFKGFVNKASKQIVAGGTGWAVEMAIQKGKEVYVFDMNTNNWYFWDYVHKIFALYEGIPELTYSFAGIGSRQITLEGIEAIRDVYRATFKTT